ncbi:MAG TPA: 16S rRNA (cytidine(1402)-2'-O)-methyltransferase [Acidimicrobiales bacterium]|nr:16S rRNA (cytidine(1402)-2'-O)-methyltransferase [Acidimicrobiales bacterium]
MTASDGPSAAAAPGAGRLVIVSTPIGNLGDLSPRAVEMLGRADLVCCEDTRRTRALLTHAGLTGRRLLSVHARNEVERLPQVLAHLAAGETVAVVSDAGTPTVSDPGGRLVAAAVAAGAEVTAVPGPSAALTALVVSGLPTARFCFEGFLARRGSDRRRRLEALATEERTTLIHEAPGRLAATLADLAAACGPEREVVVARELTKLHEEVWRGSLGRAAQEFAAREVRGEVVVVLAGARPAPPAGEDAVVAALRRHVDGGASWRDAAGAVAAELGVSRRHVYNHALALRRQDEDPPDR